MNSPALVRIRVSARLVAADLGRNRIAVALLLVLPTVFYLLIYLTTGDRPIEFTLSTTGSAALSARERDLSMLFIGMASVSGVSAFLAFILALRPSAVDRRLVYEGYRPVELLAAKIVVAAAVATLVATYVTALLPIFFRPSRAVGVFAGYLMTSLVYGALGLAVGALVRRELEGILFILLVVNVDAGWLQSPVFYAHAQNQALIRALPGHHPGQVAMVSAFSDRAVLGEIGASLLYAGALLLAACWLYWRRVRVHRWQVAPGEPEATPAGATSAGAAA